MSTLFAAAGKENQKEAPLRITFHDSNGLSVASAPEGKLELILFKSHTHSHLQIANTSDQNLTLWKPYCPMGDYAMLIEFRDPAQPKKTFSARPGWMYTGGMGNPKTFKLAAMDSIIVNLDFMGGMFWMFPVPIEIGESKELEVRVGYRSQNLTDEQLKFYGDRKIPNVWEGETMGEWQKITVRNRSGRAFGEKS